MLWLAASAGETPPSVWAAYWRQAASSCWNASMLLSLPGSAATEGPAGGPTAHAPRVRVPRRAATRRVEDMSDLPQHSGGRPSPSRAPVRADYFIIRFLAP